MFTAELILFALVLLKSQVLYDTEYQYDVLQISASSKNQVPLHVRITEPGSYWFRQHRLRLVQACSALYN